MRVYFLAEKPSALFLNGAYLGMIDGFERSVELQPSDGIFCEIAPNGGYSPVRFTINEDFLLSPPAGIRLYFSDGDAAVYAHSFFRDDPALKVLWQERIGNSLLTLCLQGKLQLNLENETGFHIISLPDVLEKSAAKACGDGYLLESAEAFALIAKDGEILVLSEGKTLSAEETLRAEVPFRDSMGHSAVCEWKGKELVSCAIRSEREPTEATYALALFESALIGADCTAFLSPELCEKAESLREFLGNYVSVVLTPERDRVGLVYERKERVFDVRYFRVELTDGKISNIKPAC